jgi:cation diffusion facilitator family transporter
MNSLIVSIIGLLVNLFLAVAKAFLGFFLNSTALIADAIHSGLDVVSSFVTFLGIKSAKKPEEKKYPYGHYRKEPLAGFVVVILLSISGIWILYEGISRFFLGGESARFSFWALILMGASIVLNEITARIKFKQGAKDKNIALIADAEHDRADVISSLGVLIGFSFIKFFPLLDAFLAIAIGAYILYESWSLGKEVSDNLTDAADLDLDKQIKIYLKKENIDFENLKTRKVGAYSFAEIKVKLNPQIDVATASNIIKNLQKELLEKFNMLKQINIGLTSHDLSSVIVSPRWGKRYSFKKGQEKIGLKKQGRRILIPIENNEISDHFGKKEYLIIDVLNNKIIRKEKIKNKYFTIESSHGIKFVKAISADEVWSKDIGKGAEQNIKNHGIKLRKLNRTATLKEIERDILNKTK